MVAHEKRNSGQLFCTVPTRNDLTLSSLIFSAQPTQKLGYPVYLFMATSAMAPMPTYTTQNRISRAEITVSMVPPTLRLPG